MRKFSNKIKRLKINFICSIWLPACCLSISWMRTKASISHFLSHSYMAGYYISRTKIWLGLVNGTHETSIPYFISLTEHYFSPYISKESYNNIVLKNILIKLYIFFKCIIHLLFFLKKNVTNNIDFFFVAQCIS